VQNQGREISKVNSHPRLHALSHGAKVRHLLIEGDDPATKAIGDFARHGRLDLAVANSGSNTISALLQGPSVSLSKTALMFADQVVGTSSAPQTVKVTDTGVLFR
jgi:hypothetical protein